jgi:hypothetical protein
MNVSDLTAFCSKLSPAELVVHLQSLMPLVNKSTKNDKNEPNRSVAQRKYDATRKNQHVVVPLSGLCSPIKTEQMNHEMRTLIETTSFDGIIVKKMETGVIIQISGMKHQIRSTPAHFNQSVHVTHNHTKANHLSESALLQLESSSVPSDRKMFRTLEKVVSQSTRCHVSQFNQPTVTCLSASDASVGDENVDSESVDDESVPVDNSLQMSVTNNSTREKTNNYHSHNHTKFNSLTVGQDVSFLLYGLYTSTERGAFTDPRCIELLDGTRLTAVVVRKTSIQCVVHLLPLDVYIQLTPNQCNDYLNRTRGRVLSRSRHLCESDLHTMSVSHSQTQRSDFSLLSQLCRDSRYAIQYSPGAELVTITYGGRAAVDTTTHNTNHTKRKLIPSIISINTTTTGSVNECRSVAASLSHKVPRYVGPHTESDSGGGACCGGKVGGGGGGRRGRDNAVSAGSYIERKGGVVSERCETIKPVRNEGEGSEKEEVPWLRALKMPVGRMA